MSLNDYDGLVQEVIDWSHREDINQRVDVFINLAETQMLSNPVEPLQLRSQEVTTPFSTNIIDRFVPLPDDYRSMRKIVINVTNGHSHELRFVTPTQLHVLDHAGLPVFFTITDQIEMDRISDVVYSGEINHYQSFVKLDSTNTVNQVLTDHPDIYLFGTLAAAFTYAQDTEQAGIYYNQFIQAIKSANDSESLGSYGPAPTIRIEGTVP